LFLRYLGLDDLVQRGETGRRHPDGHRLRRRQSLLRGFLNCPCREGPV
jgi:hypothetical protein